MEFLLECVVWRRTILRNLMNNIKVKITSLHQYMEPLSATISKQSMTDLLAVIVLSSYVFPSYAIVFSAVQNNKNLSPSMIIEPDNYSSLFKRSCHMETTSVLFRSLTSPKSPRQREFSHVDCVRVHFLEPKSPTPPASRTTACHRLRRATGPAYPTTRYAPEPGSCDIQVLVRLHITTPLPNFGILGTMLYTRELYAGLSVLPAGQTICKLCPIWNRCSDQCGFQGRISTLQCVPHWSRCFMLVVWKQFVRRMDVVRRIAS